MPLLSIIVPHFNNVDGIVRLLESIPNEHIELLIIDDKSLPVEFKRLENLLYETRNKKQRLTIKLFKNNLKKGAGTCRNIGIEASYGKFLLFADADDSFLKDFYLNVKHYFSQNNDIVFFPPTSVMEETEKKGTRHIHYAKLVTNYLKRESKTNSINLLTKFIVPWSKLYNADFIKKNRIKFQEVIVSNDIMFSTEAGSLAKNISVSSKEIYCVTQGNNSLTTSNLSVERTEIRIDVALARIEYLRLKKYPEQFISINYWIKYLVKNNFAYEFKYRMLRKIKSVYGNSILLVSSIELYKILSYRERKHER